MKNKESEFNIDFLTKVFKHDINCEVEPLWSVANRILNPSTNTVDDAMLGILDDINYLSRVFFVYFNTYYPAVTPLTNLEVEILDYGGVRSFLTNLLELISESSG